jgi:hypothetical protein
MSAVLLSLCGAATPTLTLIGVYNKTFDFNPGEYLPTADFNYDFANDISDLLIIIGSYNLQSQFLP